MIHDSPSTQRGDAQEWNGWRSTPTAPIVLSQAGLGLYSFARLVRGGAATDLSPSGTCLSLCVPPTIIYQTGQEATRMSALPRLSACSPSPITLSTFGYWQETRDLQIDRWLVGIVETQMVAPYFCTGLSTYLPRPSPSPLSAIRHGSDVAADIAID